jgi:RNA polymerase sigma-70 factor (ECF subfamily)
VTLTELYETYENKLRRYAARLARDPHWAEDLVQDTFVLAMGHLDLLGALKLDQLAHEPRSSPSREDLVLSPDPFALIPERFREMVVQRYMLGMNSREIGEALGIPAATVRSRLHLAIREARSRLQGEVDRNDL